MAEPAHVLLVLEVDIVEVEAEVALGEGGEVTEAAGQHGGPGAPGHARKPEQVAEWIIQLGSGGDYLLDNQSRQLAYQPDQPGNAACSARISG